RLPVFAGGTMLYFKALTRGLAELPAAQPPPRAAVKAEARDRGWPAMHADLAKVDPDAAQRLKPTDAQRTQRALEVFRHTGRTLTSFHEATQTTALPFEALRIALEPSERAALHERVATRFRAMLAGGPVGGVQGLRERSAP